jgi:hypothetical protein
MSMQVIKQYKGEKAAHRGIAELERNGYEVDQMASRKAMYSLATGAFTRRSPRADVCLVGYLPVAGKQKKQRPAQRCAPHSLFSQMFARCRSARRVTLATRAGLFAGGPTSALYASLCPGLRRSPLTQAPGCCAAPIVPPAASSSARQMRTGWPLWQLLPSPLLQPYCPGPSPRSPRHRGDRDGAEDEPTDDPQLVLTANSGLDPFLGTAGSS